MEILPSAFAYRRKQVVVGRETHRHVFPGAESERQSRSGTEPVAAVHGLRNEVQVAVMHESRRKLRSRKPPLRNRARGVNSGRGVEQFEAVGLGLAAVGYYVAACRAYFPAYAEWGADLVLSGHVHGGIMRLPLLGGVISPTLRLFPRYDGGLFQEGGSTMILGRGLGSHTIPIRIFNPGELVVVELEPQ